MPKFDYEPFERLETYDYNKEVSADVLQYIIDNYDINEDEQTIEIDGVVYNISEDADNDNNSRDDLIEKLNENMWIADSVTGNASGSYTFNTWKARCNLWNNEELIEEVTKEFEIKPENASNPEFMDVSIRCYLLGGAIEPVIDEIAENGIEAAKAKFF